MIILLRRINSQKLMIQKNKLFLTYTFKQQHILQLHEVG